MSVNTTFRRFASSGWGGNAASRSRGQSFRGQSFRGQSFRGQVVSLVSRAQYPPTAPAPVAYSLTCVSGSYSVTGQAATFSRPRSLTAANGSYVSTGQAATFTLAHKLAAANGGFALTGQAATFSAVRGIAAASGSYTVTGKPASLSLARSIAATSGSYAATGQAATFALSRGIVAAAGRYTLTGQGATFTFTGSSAVAYGLSCSPGSYVVLGIDAALIWRQVAVNAPAISAGGGGGIYYPRKKHRNYKTQLDSLMDKVTAEYQEELEDFANSDSEEIREIVKPHIVDGLVDYESLQSDIDVLKQLMDEFKAYLDRQDEEEILILMLMG